MASQSYQLVIVPLCCLFYLPLTMIAFVPLRPLGCLFCLLTIAFLSPSCDAFSVSMRLHFCFPLTMIVFLPSPYDAFLSLSLTIPFLPPPSRTPPPLGPPPPPSLALRQTEISGWLQSKASRFLTCHCALRMSSTSGELTAD